jgi:glucuronate isomerase
LPKVILYNLNPADNYVMAAMAGSFMDGSAAGKIQYGPGWWFLDQLEGMRRQMNALSSLGLLSRFVGMLTDSRSFMSFPRHEYFRRLLCDMLGDDVARGLVPDDYDLLAEMVRNICHDNAARYFEFPGPA